MNVIFLSKVIMQHLNQVMILISKSKHSVSYKINGYKKEKKFQKNIPI